MGGQAVLGDPAAAVIEFAGTPAFADRGCTPEQVARLLYAGVLGNAGPTNFQVSGWAGRVSDAGVAAAAAEMCSSTAFAGVCEEFGLGVGGLPVDPELPDLTQYAHTPQGYARMLYGAFLGNDSPTDFQVSWWADRLSREDPARAIADFANTPAFTGMGYTPVQSARLLYAAILGNDDPSDYQVFWWAGVVERDGVVSAASQMCASDAFKAVCAHYGLRIIPEPPESIEVPDLSQYERSPQGYARMLYGALLGNDSPTDFQVSWWAGRLSGEDAAAVLADFADTPAFTGKGYTGAQSATLLYAALLGNDSPTDFQVSWWAGVVERDGAVSAASQMCTSDAFAKVCKEFGLKA